MNAPVPASDFQLDGIVPWGRRLDEYAAFFALDGQPRQWPAILDVGAGPASFCSEAAALGARVVAVDPLYRLGGDLIRRRYAATRATMATGLEAAAPRFVWNFYPSVADVLRRRDEAIALFLEDYDWGRACGRYVAGALPGLPFRERQFDLALVSHLLFLYGHALDAGFHVAALVELARVAREVRVFPLLDLEGRRSPHLAAVVAGLSRAGLSAEEMPVGFEFQKGGSSLLRVRRRAG
jgi:SAM-dependent methyltransferase